MSDTNGSFIREPQLRHRPTVVVSNVYADANKGGAAITKVTTDFARRLVPGARIVLVTVPRSATPTEDYGQFTGVRPEELTRATPMINASGGVKTAFSLLRAAAAILAPRLLSRASSIYDEVASASAVISKGGYLFGHRSTRGILGLLVTAYPLLFATRVGIPTVVYSSSIGPFSSRAHERVVGFFLRRVSAIAVRDAASKRRAIDLGVDRNRLVSMPDCVFSWRPRPLSSSSQYSATRLCIVIRDTPTMNVLSRSLEILLKELSDSGEFQEFECVVQSVPDRGATENFAARLRSTGLNATFVDTTGYAPAAMLDVYARSAATISARLHGAIFSLLSGTPALSISIDPGKAEEVMGAVGLSDWVVPAQPDELHQITQWLREAVTDDSRAKLQAAIEAASAEVEEAERRLMEIAAVAVE